MRDRSRWTVQYMQRVLATDPIAYWMGDEKVGTAAYDMVTARSNGAQNGAYTGVALGRQGIGDGRTSGLYDGANDFTNVQSVSHTAAFNGIEGSVQIAARVSGAGVWVDGATRYLFRFRDAAGTGHQILARKTAAAGTVLFRRSDLTGNHDITVAGLASTDFLICLYVWSEAAGTASVYIGGVLQGAPVAIGGWGGAVIDTALIGAATLAPAQAWDGTIAHVPNWDRVLSPAEALSLGVV